jgi:hypothetical protein
MTWIRRWSPVYLAFFGGWFFGRALEKQTRLFGVPEWVRVLLYGVGAIGFVCLAVINQRKAAPKAS